MINLNFTFFEKIGRLQLSRKKEKYEILCMISSHRFPHAFLVLTVKFWLQFIIKVALQFLRL